MGKDCSIEQLLLAESTIRANEGDAYAALALLDEAASRNLQNPELRPRFGQIVGPMIQDAMDKEDYRKVRYLIARIEKVVPDHELIPQSKDRLQQLVASLLQTSEQHYQQRDFPAAKSSHGKPAQYCRFRATRRQLSHVSLLDIRYCELALKTPMLIGRSSRCHRSPGTFDGIG